MNSKKHTKSAEASGVLYAKHRSYTVQLAPSGRIRHGKAYVEALLD